MKLGTCMYSRVLITNLEKVFRNFDPQYFFGAISSRNLKTFVLNETWHVYVFEGANYELGKKFSKFQPAVFFFLAQFGPKI